MIQRQTNELDKHCLWSAVSQFTVTHWSGLEEIVNSKSMIRGLASANHLIQYCIERGLARSEKYALPAPAKSGVKRPEVDDDVLLQLQMFDQTGIESEKNDIARSSLSLDSLEYEYSFLKRIIIQNYGGIQALVPKHFERECVRYPFKETLRHALSTVDQIKIANGFNGYDTRCHIQPLSLPELLSARYVAQQWCEHEIRPFETFTKGLFQYAMLIGVHKESR